ncbi:hydantoinase B/oxoprolinase family protein [Sporosarcina sp. HYO08]|uniref:hydantoinase B/oxoprolinase family protein n=1 Tax=Sporosarcina sp. HYO08 TaxID=1759557 RepID=UPI000799E981|nr:hydantoinase B/oxoprolinase family protein [Sporosarcina sp. HYO08]KXH83792.1 hypothetical protein AU377_03230 [Sporosarcina sp. HYO08]
MSQQSQLLIEKTSEEQVVDAITLEVVYSSLLAAADEMSGVLGRSAYSPIIREMIDYSCGIFDPVGNLIAQAENIPAHLGSMGSALRELFRDFPPASYKPGDAFLVNDPYRGGQHTPDLHVFTPAFHGDRLVGICGTIAHHADMGGKNPGTEGFDNQSIFEEGLRIPPVQLADSGKINLAIMTIIAGNVREPNATMGDLRAQIASCRFGEGRLTELANRYGFDTLLAVMKRSMDYSALRMQTELVKMKDAESSAIGWLDDDGAGGDPVKICVKVTKNDQKITVDFTGTDPQMAGGMNVPPAAATSAVLYAIKSVVDPETPQNQGCFRPIEVVLPKGSAVNPHFPAAVSLRHLAVQRIADTILRALANLYPDRTAAGTFVGFSSLAIDSWHPVHENPRVIQDDLGGGMGAHPNGDGIDAVDTHCGNVAILPAEVSELSYLIRVRSTELIPDSGGPGKWRGGLGIRREYEIVERSHSGLVYTEQSNPDFAPWGMNGGGSGSPASIKLVRQGGEEIEMGKSYFEAQPGDRIIIETSGGGGYGDPKTREPQLIYQDVLEGKISVDAAENIYGAVIQDSQVDVEATILKRSK